MNSLRLRDFNPLRLLHTNFSYQSLPNSESRSASPSGSYRRRWLPDKLRFGRLSLTKLLALAIAGFVCLALMAGGGYRQVREEVQNQEPAEQPPPFYWQVFPRLNGYYNGIRTLVPYKDVQQENRYNASEPPKYEKPRDLPKQPPMEPIKYDPYPDYKSSEYLEKHHEVHECFVDDEDTIPVPDVYAYPGVPAVYPEPFYGSYSALGMREDVCWDRFGRLAAYGYGDSKGTNHGLGMKSEKTGAHKIFEKVGHTDYSKVDWGKAQKKCYEKNKARFAQEQPEGKERVKRHAYVLRTWTGFKYTDHHIMTLRAQINELALKSGGEYDVHFLVHVKDDSIPIWADEDIYRQVIEENVPEEFWGLATLWSEKQMEMYYPDPFPNNFINMAGSSIHGVYRSAHFAIQWFSQEFKEYDFVWNWEMDLRYTGHYYEFNNRIGEWGKAQPRKGLWERAERFYIPGIHGSYENFTKFVGEEMKTRDIPLNDPVAQGPHPVWGPVNTFPNNGLLPAPEGTTPPHSYSRDNYEWGVGEDADILTFNPIFDPSKTNWVFREDVTGYDNTLPVPPRRVAIITVARLSRRLLDTMHEETWAMRHSMFPEMWPPSVALHHGLKAAYVPHPVYFDRDWDLPYMDQVFNYPETKEASTFGWGEHNMLGSSFYYNAGFSGALWRRWLGEAENGEGGRREEESGTGRMCLRPVLHHPIKGE
ncbi:hypothetical protein WHR41_06074 [Cladosporium halotolerans]|uniref:Uncharacterized protein n=1 Tax=Cladosporium halotolerans TaxID=1052096 RepID=A0AB34KNK9_9PEZI